MAPFVIVRLILGAALTGAAALKSYQLATEPLAEGNLLSSRWLLIGVVECEFAMVAWQPVVRCDGYQPSDTRPKDGP